jgi:hypothetical protein
MQFGAMQEKLNREVNFLLAGNRVILRFECDVWSGLYGFIVCTVWKNIASC